MESTNPTGGYGHGYGKIILSYYTSRRKVVYIKNYGSNSSVKMGQVQNGLLYIRYRSSSMKNEAEKCKNLINHILGFSIAKSTV